ncbi:collagen-binding domain-containing protein [Paludisphaera mucosa]|uniref:Choice-of-anchor A family protein n=1 Tax=Paludisphaera mucosa TaxID=3030827 RepID=A0ABT6FFJ1_9BACT|nr:collagen-binding domain-containing protein [Paludisphaera mucosa]MDG3006345.1 choice-of-anchor A family protein [Paludisphaera mucosa]
MANFAKQRWFFCVLGLASTALPARADLLTNWNVVTTGDLYAASDAQGPVRVGGNLYVQNSFEVAAKQGSPTSSNPSLVVGGDVKTKRNNAETVKVLQGDAVIGGTINGASNDKARIVSTRDGGAVKMDSSVSGIGAADAKELQADSLAFHAMEATKQAIYIPTAQVDTAVFTVLSVNADGNAVFNIDDAKLFNDSNIRGFALDLNGFKFGEGQSVVFNVGGSQIDFHSGLNFDGAFRTSVSNIIWNFYDAKQIDLNRNNFAGALLASEAVLTDANVMAGSVFVGSFGTTYGNGMGAEVQAPMYLGYDPSNPPAKIASASTPEPSSLAMAGLAVMAGVATRARRRRAS